MVILYLLIVLNFDDIRDSINYINAEIIFMYRNSYFSYYSFLEINYITVELPYLRVWEQ